MLQVGFGFQGVLERFSMEIALEVVNLVFCILFLTWVLVDMMQHRSVTNRSVRHIESEVLENYGMNYNFYSKIMTTLCSATVFILYMSYALYEFVWCNETMSYSSISTALTWALSTTILVYSGGGRILGEDKNWPWILVVWWVYSLVFYMVLVALYVINRWTTLSLNILDFPMPEFVDFLAFPLSIALCFSALLECGRKGSRGHELEQPFLPPIRERSTKEVSTFECSGVWSKLSFSWLNPVFRIGRARLLELSDIPPVPQSEAAENASSLLEESLWKKRNDEVSLPNAIFSSMWRSLLANAFFAWVTTLASYMGPLLITHFVDFLTTKGDDTGYRRGLTIAIVFFIAKCTESISQRQWCFGASRVGVRVRAAIIALVYKKSLNIKSFAVGEGSGKIVNLVNVDVERLGDFFSHIHGIWLLPLQVFLALVILHVNLGVAPAIAALSTTVLVMICNTPLARRQERLHSKIMEAKDARIKATSETLKSMRVLKLHSWESAIKDKLLQLRETEESWLSKYLYTCSAVAFLFWASPASVSAVTFGVCILVKTPLTSGTVLSALATFRILQEPIYNLPELLSVIAQTKVSVARLENFLRGEIQVKSLGYHKCRESNLAIDIQIGEYSWDLSDHRPQKPTIRINEPLETRKGSKIAVCGPVGEGKSSFLCSILGEIPRISGCESKVFGSKAYVPQSSWIQSGSVRENILFGKEMNKAFYEEVLEACALNKDLQMWEDADLCIIGERGVNLSGGQKQRIQLARAIYSDADVYFLDDPFSAVDAHTCAHLFRRCLMEMLSEKTVVYITHQLEFLDASDLVLVMKDGRIVQSGNYKDLIRDPDGEFIKHIAAHTKSLEQVNSNNSANQSTNNPIVASSAPLIEEKTYIQYDKQLKSKEEETLRGRVKWLVYSAFVTAAYRGALVPVILLCQIFFQVMQMGSCYWIAWATETARQVSNKQLIGYFLMLSGGSCVFILGRTVFLSTIAIKTGHRMYFDMISSVFRAPISFFDCTPSSRILTRSSTDQSTVDMDIPYRLAGLVFALIQLVSIIVLMCQVVWQVVFLFAAVIAISCWYQAYYIASARELARMVGIQKAPILHHFSETMVGSSTIRCFNQQNRFHEKVLRLVDDYTRVLFHNIAAMEWLSVRINFLFNFVFFMVLVILVLMPSSAIDPSLSGLAATYGLSMNVLQAWIIWNLCNVENKMISVERILEFSKLPSEAPLIIEDSRPEPDWPSKGCIQLDNLHIRYSPDLPMVLKGITCTIPEQMKVGVVGRTGSGKSTLIHSLFRVVQPSEGRILIDGLDICQIGLHDLRSKLSIIPQEPTLFRGTVRANLDPLQEYSDQEIWEVLNKCPGLATIVRQDGRLLDAPVAEDGENWSVGQRQLICLARVLLQRRRILILDEATASVDTETDSLIQKTLKEETTQCTVITIAHRIATVIDSDLVLVLDQGKVVEYDSPSELLKHSVTAFSKLVTEYLHRSSKKGDET